MDHALFNPRDRTVTTHWFCAFGKLHEVVVHIRAEGVSEVLELAAGLDSMNGVRETLFPDDDAVQLPHAAHYREIGALPVPRSADTWPFCVGTMCLITALWTEQLTVAQLRRGRHPQVDFFDQAMHVLGQNHPLSRVVNGAVMPPAPGYDF